MTRFQRRLLWEQNQDSSHPHLAVLALPGQHPASSPGTCHHSCSQSHTANSENKQSLLKGGTESYEQSVKKTE